jgi:hypothetical protein
MTASDADLEEIGLFRAAQCGDDHTGQQLLAGHRGPLRQMVSVELDQRLAVPVRLLRALTRLRSLLNEGDRGHDHDPFNS